GSARSGGSGRGRPDYLAPEVPSEGTAFDFASSVASDDPSSRPFLNSFCAEPSERASFGICVLPNSTSTTTTRMMIPSTPNISAGSPIGTWISFVGFGYQVRPDGGLEVLRSGSGPGWPSIPPGGHGPGRPPGAAPTGARISRPGTPRGRGRPPRPARRR